MAYFTVPQGVGYVSFNLASNQNILLYEEGYPDNVVHSYETKIKENNNLMNKHFCAMGTSITAGTTTLETWATFIAQGNNMAFDNSAKGGATMSELIKRLDYNKTYDYVIVEGFANDLAKRPTLGVLSEKGNTDFDTETFIGELEWFVYGFKQKFPDTKFGFVLTEGQKYPKYANIYWNAVISICEKYDVPYYDFRTISYPMSDGTHPTWEGQLIMAEYIEEWMNTL